MRRSGMTAPSGLARKSIGTGPLFFFCVGASGPMIVIAGGVVATYGATGVVGVPLSFLVLAAALAFFTIGYVAMVRYGAHAATFYALLARGLGRLGGMAGGTVALAAHHSSQISLYGLGGVFAFGIAAFLGYESGPFYAEAARGQRVVPWATLGALAFMGVFYAVSSWAMAVAVGVQTVGTGPDAAPAVVGAARQDTAPIPLEVLEAQYGFAIAKLGNLLLITSVVAAMISIHNSVARYVFAMARERVLPARLGRIRDGSRGGAPVGGSLLQSALALMVVLAFVVAGADPFKTLFTWLATLAAIGVGLLMFGTSLATIGFFRRAAGNGESAWQRVWAPGAGAVALAVILVVTVVNLNSLLGTEPGSLLTWIPVAVLVAVLVAGLIWGQILRSRRPEIYRNIGVGEQEPLAVLEHALADVKV